MVTEHEGFSSVKGGQLTFNAEGNNNPNSIFYSRMIHYPEKMKSGVTIGRGYDMGQLTKSEVYSDLISAGIFSEKAKKISMAAGLTGQEAYNFVKKNRVTVGAITEQQQVSLFNHIFPKYVKRAKSVYIEKTKMLKLKPRWEDLLPALEMF